MLVSSVANGTSAPKVLFPVVMIMMIDIIDRCSP